MSMRSCHNRCILTPGRLLNANSQRTYLRYGAPPPAEMACGVFDSASETTLEHRQLRQNPKFKDIWEASYANELDRLCQGIGKDPNGPKQQQVAGTDTYRPIRLSDIPQDRQKEICFSRVVCEIRP